MSRGFGSGNQRAVIPLFIGVHVAPPSSVRNTATAEIPTTMRFAFFGSGRIVWRHSPPAPGFHFDRVEWDVSPGTSFQESPLSVERKSPAGSTPAYTTPGSAGPPPTTFHTFATLHPVFFAYAGPDFPRVHFVSVFERCTTGPNWKLFTAAHATPSRGSYRALWIGTPSKYRPASFHFRRSRLWNTYSPLRVPTSTTVLSLGTVMGCPPPRRG